MTEVYGPLRLRIDSESESSEKLFSICRSQFPQLSKRDLRLCFKNSEIFLDGQPVNGSEDEMRRLQAGREYEIKIIRDAGECKRQQMERLEIQICYQKQGLLLVSHKPCGVNGAIGRLYDEAVIYFSSLATTNHESSLQRLYAIYRLSKSIGGLCLYGTTLPSYQMLRKLLCLNLCQLSFVCIVVGDVHETVSGTTIPLPVNLGVEEEGDEEHPLETNCVMHSLQIEVLQRSPGHHIGSLSLLRVTPLFLEEYSNRKMETLLKPACPSDYQYLHYPVSVIKAIPKALRLSGFVVIGGDRGLVKASKGIYLCLDQIRFSSSSEIRERMKTVEDCSDDWEKIDRDLISIPIPQKFIKLLSQSSRGEKPEERMTTFHGLSFHITPDVMTPRPASETLVQQALLIARHRSVTAADEGVDLQPLRLLDLGTGSGSLLLACLHSLQKEGVPCYGVGIDICDKALRIAQLNATMLSLNHHTTFLQQSFTDLPALASSLLHIQRHQSDLSVKDLFPPFDIVLCNPPYSSLKEDRVSHSRRLHEPAIALFADFCSSSVADQNPVSFPVFHSLSSHESLTAFKNISSSLKRLLDPPPGTVQRPLLASRSNILIEFGNGQLDDVVKIFSLNLFELAPVTGVFSDENGFPRCLRLTVA